MVVVGQEAPHHVFEPIALSNQAPYVIAQSSQGVTFREQNEAIAMEVLRRVLAKLG